MLMTYGTPKSLNEIEAYYTHIRGGRRPSDAELENLVERYKAIGGTSPLLSITERQVRALQSLINEKGSDTRVYGAMKHSPPFISEIVEQAEKDGVDRLLCIALAPHYSNISIGSYIKAVQDSNAKLGDPIKLSFIDSWHDHPNLISAWAGRIRDAQEQLDPNYSLIFSAHSLPERIIGDGDPYKDLLLATSRLIAKEIVRDDWSFSFQSAGHTPEPWLGPDILDHLQSVY